MSTDKQKQAARDRQRRHRAKSVTKRVTDVASQLAGALGVLKLQRTDPDTLAIWARHKAQHRPTVNPDPTGKGIYA